MAWAWPPSRPPGRTGSAKENELRHIGSKPRSPLSLNTLPSLGDGALHYAFNWPSWWALKLEHDCYLACTNVRANHE